MHQPSEMLNSPPWLQQPPPASHATHLSLRGGEGRTLQHLHPLKQKKPPSIASVAPIAEDSDIANFDDVDISTPTPPPSALTAATAYDPHHLQSPSPLENYTPSPPRIGHQRSLTDAFFDNCQPLLNRATSTLQQHTSRTSFHSPTKSLASFIPSRSVLESTASQPKIRAGAKVLQDWFNGSSGPVALGVTPPKEDSDAEYDSEDDEDENMMAGIFNRTPALTRSATTNDITPKQSTPTAGSKFAWLLSTQKNAALPSPAPSPTYHDPSDELLNLNISTSLFPHGPVDPLAPSSFNDLLSTAESLLARYQSSYRQLSSALVDARAEQSAQDDELEEADTRARHLKMQLETMAARANEQDEQMRRLMEELTFERRARQEEEEARKRSLTLVRGTGLLHGESEDISRRRNRVSNSDVSVDSGFESECDTDATSLFSRTTCLSPTESDPSPAASEVGAHETTPKSKKPQPLQRRSTYDKVRDGTVDLERGGWGCVNCEGGSQGAVWGRLAREREENSHLRRRVASLEEAVDGALSVVDGPWRM